ncbi:MAG: hypothetical protein V7727_19900, partial [Sneathiella sp.]
AETLLTGRLPGSHIEGFYMTGWHQRELAARLERHHRDIGSLGKKEIEQISKEIGWKARMRERLEGKITTEPTQDDFSDYWLQTDQRSIRQESDEETSKLLGQSRRLSRMFVKCSLSERIEQLNRIAGLGIAERIESLEVRLRVSADSELVEATKMWLTRLLDESHLNRGAAKRKRAGFVTDANSIALIQWISENHLSENQRIVLVTGDQLLYNAYRRWYCSSDSGSAEAKNFVLR